MRKLLLTLALSCVPAFSQATLGTSCAGETRIQNITTTFVGGNPANGDTGQGVWPDHMDPGIGVGISYIVSFSRQGMFIYDKSCVLQTTNTTGGAVAWSTPTGGGGVLNGFLDTNTFWKTISGISSAQDFIANATNPQVIYDFQAHRWYVSQTIYGTGTNNLTCAAGAGDLLAVSLPDDPFHWKAIVVGGANGSYPFNGKGTPRCGDWQANVGYNANVVVYCVQDTATGSPNSQGGTIGSICSAWPKADLQWVGAGAPVQTHQTTWDFLSEGRYHVAMDYTPTTTNGLAIVARGGYNQNTTGSGGPLIVNMRLFTVSGTTVSVGSLITPTNSYTYQTAAGNINNTFAPFVSAQGNGGAWYLRNQENTKPLSPKQDSQGNVWFGIGAMNSIIAGAGHNTGFFWFEVDKTGTVLNTGSQFDSSGTVNYRYPVFSIYDDQAGSVTGLLFYDQASTNASTGFLSHYVRVLPAHSSTLGSPLLLKQGTAVIAADTSPTPKNISNGTWISAVTDPADTSKQWLYAQYGGNSPSASTNYTAWISQAYNIVTVSSADATVPKTVAVSLVCTDNNGIDVSAYCVFSASSGGGLGSFTSNVFTAGGAAGTVTFSATYQGATSPNKTIIITSPGATLNSVTASVASGFILDNTTTTAFCTAHYSDGTNPDVTGAATFSISSGGTKASVSGTTVSGIQGGGTAMVRCTFSGVNSGSSGGDAAVIVTSSAAPSGKFVGKLLHKNEPDLELGTLVNVFYTVLLHSVLI